MTHLIPSGRYISFSLGKEEFAIPLLDVREVIALPEFTSVPFTPTHFLGIMNLRGQVISVIDLRIKLGIKPDPGPEAAVIICDFGGLSLGVLVDAINSVVTPHADEISEKPEIESKVGSEYISAVYRKNDKLILILDIAKALTGADREALLRSRNSASGGAPPQAA